jgi:alkanesulfonate monooxygenase SsuD/methylene tetrahydromethanopterin reductase-like flavin-dependent oxidoreductase (luciferase family)
MLPCLDLRCRRPRLRRWVSPTYVPRPCWRAITSLSTLSGGRVLLGIGAGAIWDMIEKLGAPRLDGGSAVRAMAEAITLIRALSGGGEPVTFDGEFYHVSGLDPADAPVPRVLTGSVGPKSLAVTGQLADGWIPPMASDWLSPLYRESRPRIDAAAAAAGRDPAEIATVYNFGGRVTPEPLAATRARTAAGSAVPSSSGSTSSPPPCSSITRAASFTGARTIPRPPRHWPAGPPRSSQPSAARSPTSRLAVLYRHLPAAQRRPPAGPDDTVRARSALPGRRGFGSPAGSLLVQRLLTTLLACDIDLDRVAGVIGIELDRPAAGPSRSA